MWSPTLQLCAPYASPLHAGAGRAAGEVGSRGDLPNLGREKIVAGAPRPPNPHHPHSWLPQREPGSWVTSDPWILEPGPWALLPPSPTWCSLETSLLLLGMAHATGGGVTVASFGSFLTRGACRWTQAVSPVASLGLPTFSWRGMGALA